MKRPLLGLIVGLVAISVIAESIEYLSVTLLNGAVTTNQAVYFGIRNRPLFLLYKLAYNSFAAWSAGYLAAKTSGKYFFWIGSILALIQVIGIIYAMLTPELYSQAPSWMWYSLIATMTPFCILGAKAFEKTKFKTQMLVAKDQI